MTRLVSRPLTFSASKLRAMLIMVLHTYLALGSSCLSPTKLSISSLVARSCKPSLGP